MQPQLLKIVLFARSHDGQLKGKSRSDKLEVDILSTTFSSSLVQFNGDNDDAPRVILECSHDLKKDKNRNRS